MTAWRKETAMDMETRLAILEQSHASQKEDQKAQAAKFDLAIGQLMSAVQDIKITLASQVKCVSPNSCVELSKGLSQLHERLAQAEARYSAAQNEFAKQVAQAKGAAWVLGILWPILIAAWQIYAHFSTRSL